MSASEPPEDPNAWNADDTSAIPVGPEPEPTGAGAPGGPGGWGGTPRVEPFAIAALVWALVSIVIPLVGTIVAFVLAARAADLIRRSRGEKSGTQYVTAARVIAAVVLGLWIIGLIAFFALDGGDSGNNVAIPTKPPITTIAPPLTTTTTKPLTTTTTKPPVTTTITVPPPTITVIPPPVTTVPPTSPPTQPTIPPTQPTIPPTQPTVPDTTTTSKPLPTTTTNPDAAKAAKVQAKLVTRVGASNRGVPNDERFAVSYTPGKDLLVTWAINNGTVGEHPTGTPNCTAPPTDPPPTSSTTTTTTTLPVGETTTTTTSPPNAQRTTQEQARYEAQQMLASIKQSIRQQKLDVSRVQLIGTYPIEGTADSVVVQVLYSKATVLGMPGAMPDYRKAFDAPPAEAVQCLNSAFDLP
jgi:hypothetical protein